MNKFDNVFTWFFCWSLLQVFWLYLVIVTVLDNLLWWRFWWWSWYNLPPYRLTHGGVRWSFFKEATSFVNRFISSSKFSLGFCMFSLSAFDVGEAVDLGLLWPRLFFLFISKLLGNWSVLLLSAIFCLLSILWMLVLLSLRRMLA